MKERFKERGFGFVLMLTIMLALLGFTAPALAGDLEPAGPPGSTMHTLEEIYNKVEAIDNKITPVPAGPPAPVAKTGQTKCYDATGAEIDCSGTGQDGEYQKGVASPSPRFTDNSDGTVTDNLTGLIWLKNAHAAGAWKTWADALTYCSGLKDGDAGLSDGSTAGDWRLPNVRELFSLIDFGQYMPVLPVEHPFTGVQSSYYWSGSTYAGITGRAWVVGVFHGAVDSGGKSANVADVWPVRGGN